MVHDLNLRKSSVAAMSILQLIICGIAFLMFFIGYKIGHRDGYIVGRKAVRKHYAQLEQVRA
jgi:hypothetical protein